jgi:sec-independent protein translocase protein TatA
MFDISPLQIIIVLAIALLVFGPKRLPEMGRNLGRGIRDFRGGLTGEQAPATPAPTTATLAAEGDTAEPTLQEILAEADGAAARADAPAPVQAA